MGCKFMETFKIIHTGDLHLCSPMLNMGDKSESRKRELLETFSKIIKLAETEKADALFIAGDLFETSNPDAETLKYVCGEFERIGNIRVFVVLGNHDYGLKYEFPSNVHLFKNYIEKISVENVDVYGVSFDEEHCARCIIEGFTADDTENINILVVHGDVQSTSLYNPVKDEDIKYSKMDYVALGHVHSHNGFEKVGSTTYSYCGIPEGRAFDECGEKGVVVAEVGKGYAVCRFVPLCSRKYLYKTVDISDGHDNFEFAQIIESTLEGTENAYRINLVGTKDTFVDVEFIKNYLEKSYYFIEVEDNTDEDDHNVYSLKNLFIKNCYNEDALKYGLSALRGEKVTIE